MTRGFYYIGDSEEYPNGDSNTIFISGYKPDKNLELQIKIRFGNEVLTEDIYKIKNSVETRRIRLHEFNEHHTSHLWTPENPYLYDVEFRLLCDHKAVDEVYSYFGMRKIEVDDN